LFNPVPAGRNSAIPNFYIAAEKTEAEIRGGRAKFKLDLLTGMQPNAAKDQNLRNSGLQFNPKTLL